MNPKYGTVGFQWAVFAALWKHVVIARELREDPTYLWVMVAALSFRVEQLDLAAAELAHQLDPGLRALKNWTPGKK